MKKDTRNWFIGIAVIVVIAIILFPGLISSIGAMVTGTINFCDATPFDAKCICHEGEQKALAGIVPFSYACETIVEPPASYSFPLETWEEARAFAEAEMNGVVCESPFALYSPQEGPIDISLDFVSIECRDVVGTRVVWELLVSPQDGYVWRLSCDETLVDGCPLDKPFTPKG